MNLLVYRVYQRRIDRNDLRGTPFVVAAFMSEHEANWYAKSNNDMDNGYLLEVCFKGKKKLEAA